MSEMDIILMKLKSDYLNAYGGLVSGLAVPHPVGIANSATLQIDGQEKPRSDAPLGVTQLFRGPYPLRAHPMSSFQPYRPTHSMRQPNLRLPAVSILTLCSILLLAFASLAKATSQYSIQVGLGNLTVGESLGHGGAIVILRPSPGDHFWYRLPHRVEVVGELPPGIELQQKGAGFHDLARFVGAPTRAGTYSVNIQATMADGLKTNSANVTFFIEDPKLRTYNVQTWGAERLLAGVAVSNAGFMLVNSEHGLLRAPLVANASGLPGGVAISWNGQGAYPLSGIPSVPGEYPVKVEFRWPDDGSLAASSQFTVQVFPDDESVMEYRLTLLSMQPLRQGVTYADYGFQAPWFYVEDQFGRRSEGAFTYEASGLPEGMSFSAQGFLVGRPRAAGTYEISLQVTLPNRAKTNTQTLTLQVRPSLSLAQYAGIYDCNIERSETLNGNLGGRLRFTISDGGQVSGFLIHNDRRFPFTSRAVVYDESSDEWTITTPNADLIVRGNFLEESDYSIDENTPFIRFYGLASQSDESVAVPGSTSPGAVSVNGWRAVMRSTASPSPYAGTQPVNIMFVSNEETVQKSDFGGAGFMAMNVSAAGNATITVWAADGSAPVSFATTIVESSIGAFIPAYAIIRNSSGPSSLMGELFLNVEGEAAGQLSWFQRPSNRGAFPEGIDLITYEGVIGSRHASQPQGLNSLGLEQSITDAQIDLIGEEVPVGNEVNLSLNRSKMLATPAAGQAVSQVRLNYQARSGVVTGTMLLGQPGSRRARTVTFRGMRSADGQSLLGHFTVPRAANAKRTSAGMMKISAKNQ